LQINLTNKLNNFYILLLFSIKNRRGAKPERVVAIKFILHKYRIKYFYFEM
jgi:hypothetical protein